MTKKEVWLAAENVPVVVGKVSGHWLSSKGKVGHGKKMMKKSQVILCQSSRRLLSIKAELEEMTS
jgi:hypothetical protein